MERNLSERDVQLTHVQYIVLEHIIFEPLTIADLSRRFGVDPSTLVPVVDALEEKGFVVRGRDPNDRRRMPLSATQAGADLLHQHHDIGVDAPLRKALNDLGDEGTAALLANLREVVAHLPEGADALANIELRLQIFGNEEHEATCYKK